MADLTPTSIDLSPEIVHIEIPQRTSAEITFLLAGANLTADSVKFTAKTDFNGAVTIATKTNGPGQHSNAAAGETTFVLTVSDLTTTTPADEVRWVYEVRRMSGVHSVVYIQGELKLTPSVGSDA